MINHRTLTVAGSLLVTLTLCLVAMPASGQTEIPLSTDSDEAREHFEKGRTYLDNLRRPEAREAFTKAIQADPNFAFAHLHRAWASSSTDDFYNHLGHAVDLADKATPGERLTIMAAKAGADGNQTKQIELWKRVTEMHPGDKRAHQRLAGAYNGQDMDEKALATYKQAIKVDPDWAPPYNALGYMYRNAGQFDKAEESFKKYVSLLPDEPNPYDSLADLYTKLGRHEEAIETYSKAVELAGFALSQRNIGDNYVFMGQFDKGRDAYMKAVELEDTENGKVTDLIRISFSYLIEGDVDKALKSSEKALKAAREAGLANREASIHAGVRAEAFSLKGDFDAAQKSVAECRKIIKNSGLDSSVREGFEEWAVWQEGLIAARKGDMKRAEAKIDQHYAQIDADNNVNELQWHNALVGLVKLQAGDYASAVKHLKQADLDDPYMVYHLALAENGAGNSATATDLLTKVSSWNENGLGYAVVKSQADNELTKMRAGIE